jgi:hypothetical protein
MDSRIYWPGDHAQVFIVVRQINVVQENKQKHHASTNGKTFSRILDTIRQVDSVIGLFSILREKLF